MTTIEKTTETTVALVDGVQFQRALKNAILFASPDKARGGINSVRLTLLDDVLTLESTDSYVLFRERIQLEHRGDQGTFLLALDDAKAISRSVEKLGIRLVIDRTDDWTATLSVENGLGNVVTVREVPARFPDVESLRANSTGEIATVGFSANILGRIAKIKRDIGKELDLGAPVTFAFGLHNLKPVTATVGDRIDLLVMPVRVS